MIMLVEVFVASKSLFVRLLCHLPNCRPLYLLIKLMLNYTIIAVGYL